MLRILERNLPYRNHRARFAWAYLRNPAGRASSWLAIDETSGEPVGVASVFPKMMWIDGRLRLCGQVGDFAVDAKYRSLGPALALQRATLKHVDDGALSLCYDCPPHERGMAPFRRLGLDVSCRMGRFCRLLRFDSWLRDQLNLSSGSARILAAVPNQLLRIRGFRARPSGVEVGAWSERFGAEFTRLDEAVIEPSLARARRAAEDLNWRYLDDPIRRFRIVAARRRGELSGFLVYETEGERANVCDLFATSTEVGMALLSEATAHMQESQVSVVTFIAPETGAQSALLRLAGFSFRGSVERIVAYTAPKENRGMGGDHAWFMCWSDVSA